MDFDDLFDDPLDFIMFDEIINCEWRDEYKYNVLFSWVNSYERFESKADSYLR